MTRSTTLAIVLLAGVSCGRVSIEGTVVNPRGEALPGVVVQAGSDGPQDLSDVRGEYRLRLEPGAHELAFSKSGYTVAERQIDVRGARSLPLDDTILWSLPMQPGVYLVNDFRYRETQRFVPNRFFLEDETVTLGIEADPRVQSVDAIPFILCYRTPRYDARLSRLIEVQATRPLATADTFPVWVAAGTRAVSLDPVDRPNADLLRIAIDQPLEPGVYAVHWGALEGYNTLDNRIYVFKVLPPPEELPEPDAPAAVPDAEEAPGDTADAAGEPPDETV